MKFKHFISVACAVLALAACNGAAETDVNKGNATDDSVSKSTLTLVDVDESIILPAKGGIHQIGYTIGNPSKQGFLTAECQAEWVFDIMITDDVVSFQFRDNEEYDTDRSTSMVITYRSNKETGPSKTLTLTQLSNSRPDPVLEAVTTPIAAPYSGGDYTVEYTVEWPVEGISVTANSEAEWISDIAVDEEKVAFKVKPNDTLAAREDTLRIFYGSLQEKVPVSQAAAPTPVLAMAEETVPVSEDGVEASLGFVITNPLSSLTLEASADVEWVGGFKIGDGILNFTVEENLLTEERTATITLAYKDGDAVVASCSATLTQAASTGYPAFKTAFSAQGWSWEAGDVVTVQLVSAASSDTYDMWKFSARESSAVSKLDIVDGATWSGISENWKFGNYAFFPKELSGAVTYNKASNTVSLAGTIANVSNPSRLMPLIGYRPDDSKTYTFHPAAGFIKAKFTNVPSGAGYAALKYGDNATYALNGTFSFDSDCVIKEENVQGTKWGEKYVSFTVPSSGTVEICFPVPVGTLPAGLTLKLLDAATASVSFIEYTTEEPIELAAGQTVSLPDQNVPESDWTSLGKGWFGDNYLFYQMASDKPGRMVQVEIEQSISNPAKYRVLNPYGAAAIGLGVSLGGANDSYLVFTVDGDAVSFESHASGILFSNATYTNCNTQLVDVDSGHDAVVRDGSAVKVVNLSPKYFIESSAGAADYSVTLSDRSAYANMINIVFPGYPATAALEGKWGINGTTNYFVMESISDGDFNVAITRYVYPGASLDIEGVCKGTYSPSAGTIVFPTCQVFADTGDTWTGANHTGSRIVYSFRSYSASEGAVDLTFSMGNVNGWWYQGADKFCLDKWVEDFGDVSGYTQFHQYGNPPFYRF